MPPKRRTSAPTAAARRAQGTLSFGKGQQNRVTKPTNTATQPGKPAKKGSATVDVKEPTTAEAAIIEQAEAETKDDTAVADPLADDASVKAEDVLGGRAPESTQGATGGALGVGWVDDEETRARKLPEKDLKAYWRRKEAERKAPRVHQENLTVSEKVLREWDMSGQYGPCIGIARLKRWKRANVLGLQPPIEVLAVLLQGQDAGDLKMQRAHVDELLSSKFIET